MATFGAIAAAGTDHLVVTIAQQSFALPIEHTSDVFAVERLAPVALAPPWFAGLTNVRGRIVPVIDAACLLGFRPAGERPQMAVRVAVGDEVYGLMVHSVGDVVRIPPERVEPIPVRLDAHIASACSSLYRSGDDLLLILNTAALITELPERAATQHHVH